MKNVSQHLAGLSPEKHALQQDEFSGDGLRRQIDYWRDRLSGRLPVLELPGDRPRPANQNYRGEVYRSALPMDLHDGIKRLARESGSTPFMVVLAAWQVLLMRYSGQTDMIVGAGVANRRRKELEPLIGFFVNILALRTDLSGDPPFRQLLDRVKEATLDAYSNQDVPIERVLEELDLERAMSHSPLFQTMLFYQNFPAGDAAPSGLKLTPVHFDRVNAGGARCDLSLFVAEEHGALALFFEYATDLFDEATIVQLAAHFRQVVAAVATAPEVRIGDIELLTMDERNRMLVSWNDTGRELPCDTTVCSLIETQCARTPGAVAVQAGDDVLTYAELDVRATALSRRLRAEGVGRGALVGLMVERTPGMLVALLGILKSGAAYVPMDPSYPSDRLSHMLEASGARVIVAERALLASLPGFQGSAVLLDDPHSTPIATAMHSSERMAGPSDPAYVIFTSGSTGRPKGVGISHRAAVNFLRSMARVPGMSAADVVCAVTTLSFDIAVLELLLPLTVGARVALVDRATASDGRGLAACISRSRATVMQATPATWRMLLDGGWSGHAGLRILCGGEALPRELADRLHACGAELWNMYGPTETTVWSMVERVTPDEPVHVGQPIENTQVYIVDRNLRPVPAGVPGELLIGGLGVATGYVGRADATAEKFIPDLFGRVPGTRLYRTGDLARWRRDGRVEVLGRIDNQIKLRGFRIEPGEIESVLLSQPGVAQAVVICREDRPGDRRLVAYVTFEGKPPEIRAMRDSLNVALPDYMVPSAFVVLHAFPLTPNGKVDHFALPVPKGTGNDREVITPRTPEERELLAYWQDLLGVERIDMRDNFFELGGHSLLATRLLSRIARSFGTELSLRALFDAPTLEQLAARVAIERDRMPLDDIDGLLASLEGISDAEASRLTASGGLE